MPSARATGGIGHLPPASAARKPQRPKAAAAKTQTIGTPGPFKFLIECASLSLRLYAPNGADAPVLTGGFGGVSRIARPRRVSATDYQGVDPYVMTVPIRFDGYDDDRSVEPKCDAILAMARNTSDRYGPRTITVTGPVPLGSVEWLIDDVAWGPSLWLEEARTRQDLTLTLVQRVTADTVAISPAARAKQAAKGKSEAKRVERLASLISKELNK